VFKPQVNAKYLYNYINANIAIFENLYEGNGRKHLNINAFKNLQIPIPPLNIQNQIITQIEFLQSESSHYETYAKCLEKELDSISEIIQNMIKDKADFNDNWNNICTKYNLDTISDDETQDIDKFIKCQTKFLYKIIPKLANMDNLDDSNMSENELLDTEDKIMVGTSYENKDIMDEENEDIIDEENEKLNERIGQSTKVIRTK